MKNAETLEYCPISKAYKVLNNEDQKYNRLYYRLHDPLFYDIGRRQYENKMRAEKYIFEQSQKYEILKYRLWWFGAIAIIILFFI